VYCRQSPEDFLDRVLGKEPGFVLVSHHQTVKFRKDNRAEWFRCLSRVFIERKIFLAGMEVLLGQILLQSLKRHVHILFQKVRPVCDVSTTHGPVTLDVLAHQLNHAIFWVRNTPPSSKIVGGAHPEARSGMPRLFAALSNQGWNRLPGPPSTCT